MSTQSKTQITLSLTRALSLFFLFIFLGLYLWAVQLAYDRATYGLVKALLFSLIVFGGGLSWDVLKEIARLPDHRMNFFARSMRNALIWMLLYIAFFIIGFQVLGAWAGIATIGVLFYWLFSAWALYKCFVDFERAMKSALPENSERAA
jgi:hypothetical protein